MHPFFGIKLPCVFSIPKTSLPMFRNKQFAVKRRFSDFLGLYEKLSEKHSQNGFIVPPPPEKSLIGKPVVFNSAWIFFSFALFLQYTFCLVYGTTSINTVESCGQKRIIIAFPINLIRSTKTHHFLASFLSLGAVEGSGFTSTALCIVCVYIDIQAS